MSNNVLKVFLSRLYHSRLLRIVIALLFLLSLLLWLLAYKYAPYYLNKTIKETYHQQTGHELTLGSLQFDPRQATLQLRQLKDSKHLWSADQVFISINIKDSIHQRAAIINRISIDKLNASLLQNEQGQWNFNDVLHQLDQQQQKAPKTADKNTPVFIKKLSITQAVIQNQLDVLKEHPLSIAPLNIDINNIDLRTKSASQINVSTVVNNEINILAKGYFTLSNQSAELEVDIHGVPFNWFNSFVKPYAAVEILQGTISAQNHVSVVGGELVALTTKGGLANLKLRPTSVEQDAIKWKSLEWDAAEISFKNKTLRIPELRLNELDSQFIIGKDRKTNLQAMLIPSPVKPVQNISEASAPPKQAVPEWKFSIDKLSLDNAALGFYDESLTPRFMTIIQKFTGDIKDISNNPDKKAIINLQGNVDGYAPVSLTGDAQLFAEKPQLNALMSFHSMDMGAFSPYSAEYAGWRIKKGLLSVDLNYHYQDGKIIGKNHVVMDHLEFGEKVRGMHVMDIPLRAGLALLTDAHGIAVLDTEVSGEPSDPKFNFRDIITRAIQNSFKKLLSAPFRLIANLLNTKKDLGAVQFTAGEYQLTEEAISKLSLLQQAMQKRPKMRLTLQGTYDALADTRALQEEQVTSLMQKEGIALSSIKARNESWAKAVDLRYQASGLTHVNATAEEKYQELIAQEQVTQERLNNLSYQRAQAVKQYFVLHLGVMGDALFLNSDTECSATQCKTSEVVFTVED